MLMVHSLVLLRARKSEVELLSCVKLTDQYCEQVPSITFDQANVKDDETFQTTKSNKVDQYFTTLLQHVGVVSGLSERPSLSVYYKRFGNLLFTTAIS